MAFTRVGYGQVEPNQLSAQKTGQIYASLPLDEDVNVLQNGEFMYYDYVTNQVTADDSTGIAEPMLVFNEIKLYEPFWRRSYKDFAMIRVGDNYVTSKLAVNGPIEGRYDDGALTVGIPANPAHPDYPYRMDGIAPRLFKTNIGDIYTTNMVKELTGNDVYAPGELLVPVKDNTSKTLVLERYTATTEAPKPTGMAWAVVKVYQMPDGQDGLKLQRVQ